MIDINLLDKALQYLDQKKIVCLTKNPEPRFNTDEMEYLYAAFMRLTKDGYASNPERLDFKISMAGALALQERYFLLFRGRPYRGAKFKKGMDNLWQIVKIIAAVINAIVLLILALLTFVFKD